MVFLFTVFLFIAASFPMSRADSLRAPVYNTTRATEVIKIDGVLNESDWNKAESVIMNYEIQPGDNSLPREKTEVRILYNDNYLYFAFTCYDKNPSEIRATLSDRDQIYREDFVFVGLETFGEKQRMYEFLANPLGVQADLMRVGNNEDDTYDALWYSHGVITDSGYNVEIAVPFRILKFQNSAPMEWGLLLGRNYPRETRYIFSWSPFDRDDPCFICQSGKLTGLPRLEIPVTYELLPYIIGHRHGNIEDYDDPSSPFIQSNFKGRAGLGLKVLPTSDITLETVINPDFSQIESDAKVISVNSPFAVFYPEKRPFFLEGLDIFRLGGEHFYSRMINDPVFALKMTGKAEKLTYAVLGGSDKNSPLIVPGTDYSEFVETGMRSFSGIVRARYDYGDESFLGVLLSNKKWTGANNFAGGIDWKAGFAKYYYFRGEAMFSSTRELDDLTLYDDSRTLGNTNYDAALNGEKYNGYSVRIALERSSRNNYFILSLFDVSPTFQSHTGFINRVDRRMAEIEAGYIVYNDSSFLERINLFINHGSDFTYKSIRKDQWVFLGISMTLPGQTNLTIGAPVLNREIFRGKEFHNIARIHTNLNSSLSKYIDFYYSGVYGRNIYRDDPPELGTGFEISAGITFKPFSSFKTSLDVALARLKSIANSDVFYDGYIVRNTTYYLLSKESQFRLISEYDSFSTAFYFYPLFSYKLNPFTTFFIGTTHDFRDYGNSTSFIRTGTQYFIKLQYLWSNL
ncbi:MAG: carbohydrate binding family 9 domain-containing protein [Ignavibacteriaceae bacterium]|nr:carbohydrate binding family 9 domain-containing protein [Ignavibacteriaceae bacterium]